MPDVPLVVACLAPSDLRPEVNPLSGEVVTDPRRASLSPANAAALEQALRVSDAWGGKMLAVAAGTPDVESALREAKALGASVLRVEWPPPGSGGGVAEELAGDVSGLAAALAAAIVGVGKPALVVCGDRSPLRGVGAVPGYLAHHLGASQALGLVSLRIGPGAMELTAERRLDHGWREVLRIRPPSVCSVEAAGVRLRRAPLDAALAAVHATVPVVVPSGARAGATPVHVGAPLPYRPRTKTVASPVGGTRERLLALTGALESRDPPRIVGPCDAASAADELLAFLERHGYR